MKTTNTFKILPIFALVLTLSTQVQADDTKKSTPTITPAIVVAPVAAEQSQTKTKPAPQKTAAKPAPVVEQQPQAAEKPVVVVSAAPQVAPKAPQRRYSLKGKWNFGFSGVASYERSTYESLYVDFSTTGAMKAWGVGFAAGAEYGVSDELTAGIDIGFSRILSINRFTSQSRKNYFLIDLMGRYHFLAGKKLSPFASFGLGAHISTKQVIPTLNAGGGIKYKINNQVALTGELLIKTAILHNRGEARIGVSYSF